MTIAKDLFDILSNLSSQDFDDIKELTDRALTQIEKNQTDPSEKADEIVSRALHKLENEEPARIALAGQTSGGKSSLINSLFGSRVAEIQSTSDTTEHITRTEFTNGLVLYDTPGVGGNEKLENTARAFLRIDQDSNLLTVDKIPYKQTPDSALEKIELEDIENVAPIDSVVFVFDGSRAMNRFEREHLKNTFLELESVYNSSLIVVATHLDELNSLSEEEKEGHLETISSISKGRATTVSNKSGENLDKLTNEIFKSLPSSIDLSTLQSALREERKISRLEYVITNISKIMTEISYMHGDNVDDISSATIAAYTFIKLQYSIPEEEWNNVNGRISEINDKLMSAGTKKVQKKRDPRGFMERIWSFFGGEYYKEIEKSKKIGFKGIVHFLPEISSLVASYEKGFEDDTASEKTRYLLREEKSSLGASLGVEDRSWTGNEISSVLNDVFDIGHSEY